MKHPKPPRNCLPRAVVGWIMTFALLIVAAVVGLCALTWAAGASWTITAVPLGPVTAQGPERIRLDAYWVGDNVTGDPGDTIINPATYGILGWYAYSIETDPGSVAPTAGYDITWTDLRGLDLAGGLLADRSATATEKINLGTTAAGYPVVDGNTTLAISGTTTPSGNGTISIIFLRN